MSAALLTLIDPAGMGKALANRARSLRLLRGWTRETLAKRAGVTAASLKRFENTGRASMELLLNVAHALARLDEFDKLLRAPGPRSLAELERRTAAPLRRRGRI